MLQLFHLDRWSLTHTQSYLGQDRLILFEKERLQGYRHWPLVDPGTGPSNQDWCNRFSLASRGNTITTSNFQIWVQPHPHLLHFHFLSSSSSSGVSLPMKIHHACHYGERPMRDLPAVSIRHVPSFSKFCVCTDRHIKQTEIPRARWHGSATNAHVYRSYVKCRIFPVCAGRRCLQGRTP